MAGPMVVTVLSTGRCGDGWLASGVRDLYPHVDAAHLPLGPRYAPRRYFRRYGDPDAILAVPAIRDHIVRIEHASHPYVETGWPLLSALPLLAERVPDRLRIVHLTRHPVPSALAHLADRMHAGGKRDDAYTRLATLSPFDRNVVQSDYAAAWSRLSPFEKCLFWWTEVHLFGLELPGRYPAVPFLRIASERLLAAGDEALRRLLAFIELPWDPRWLDRGGLDTRRWDRQPDDDVDPLEVHRHPLTVEVAGELGYQLRGLTRGRLQEQYDTT